MLHFDKFYNRNKIVEHSGLSREAVEELVSDLPVTRLGNRKLYSGADVLIKLHPHDIKFRQLKNKLLERG